MSYFRGILALSCLLCFGGCFKWAGEDRMAMAQTELYFGMKGPKGAVIPDSSFRRFIEAEVSPRFPMGYTLRQAEGQWQMKDGSVVSEPSRLLTLVHPRRGEYSLQIDSIADSYCDQFEQEAVMRISRKVQAAFPDGK